MERCERERQRKDIYIYILIESNKQVVARMRERQNQSNKLTCRILGFHSGDYEERRLFGCGAV
jgi:hypothetical protein